MWSDFLILGLCWIAYGTVHSLLAAPAIADRIKPLWGAAAACYRLTYDLVSVVGSIPILLFSSSIQVSPMLHWMWPYTVIQYLC